MTPRHLSRGELVGLVRRIAAAEGTEAEVDRWMDVLRANVPDPEVLDLIFWPPGGESLAAAEVIERALAYRPIALPPSEGAPLERP